MIRPHQFSKSSFVFLVSMFVIGCADPNPVAEEKKPTNIIGRTTQDIGEYDPNGQDKEADLQVKRTDSQFSAAGTAYGFAVSEISKIKIQQALQIYNAINERYPESLDEFMEEIIKKNNIELPVLPGGRRYQYDVANRELKVVEAK